LSEVALSISLQPTLNRKQAATQLLLDRYSLMCTPVRNIQEVDNISAFTELLEASLTERFDLIAEQAKTLNNGESLSLNKRIEIVDVFQRPLISADNAEFVKLKTFVGNLEPVSQLFVETPGLGTVAAQTDWIVIGSGVMLVLVAPSDQQEMSLTGTGPSNWTFGTATKLFRIRNSGEWNVEKASKVIPVVLGLTSEPTSTESLVENGHNVHEITFEIAQKSWSYHLKFLIENEYTYVAQSGCPTALYSECEQFRTDVWAGWSTPE
jgi:hypothetical protein